MKCLYNGRLIIKGEIYRNKAVIFDEQIRAIVDEKEIYAMAHMDKIDVGGRYISPGFIDLHIHGYDGYDTMDGCEEAIQRISEGIARNGVTAFLPTTMTMPLDKIYNALYRVRQVKQRGVNGAEVLGVHMEGPFINRKFKGAQDEQYIRAPDFEIIREYKDIISLITLAPELEGALEFIKKVKNETHIVLSMGHTNASYEEALEGISCGISHVTHLFNAMTGLHHRSPGGVGAALTRDITCEVIADTIHIHPELFEMILKVKGLDNIILVTDSMGAAGKEDGEYTLGGQRVFVKNGYAKLEDGTLAGGILKLNKAVYNFSRYTPWILPKLISTVTINPAKALGIDKKKGSIEVGKDADITIFDEAVDIYLTFGKGKILYEF
ncbi:MAG: N-acetylglucosamine-6-phosphate deacetylase [Epulopiscium sp.]|nr:N-acetylglucosamine-6-phosphate deacetylase [Candidatus Epulonipiscium sp.]